MASNNPAVLGSLMPGANVGGSSVAVPTSPLAVGQPSIGGNTNPMLPVPAGGTSMAPMTNPSGNVTPMPANAGGGAGGAVPPLDVNAVLGNADIGRGTPGGYSLWRGFMKMGYPSGIAGLLAQFLAGGAGYNSQVAQNLIAQMQPSIERGTENIMEQFSAMGNRFGSPAAVGLADFQSQVQLGIGEILSNLYEQSVQNYLQVLMGSTSGRNEHKKPGIFQQIQQVLGDAAGGLAAAGLG